MKSPSNLESYDAAGKLIAVTEEIEAPMLVDTTTPKTTVTVDGNVGKGKMNYQDVTITPTAVYDAKSGLDFIEYRIDDTEWVKVDLNKRFTVSGHGVHNVKVRSVDKAGNVEPFHRFDICIDESDISIDEIDFSDGTLSVVLTNRCAVDFPAVMMAALIDKSGGKTLKVVDSTPALITPRNQNTLKISGINELQGTDC